MPFSQTVVAVISAAEDEPAIDPWLIGGGTLLLLLLVLGALIAFGGGRDHS
jgi:hypothetical protein